MPTSAFEVPGRTECVDLRAQSAHVDAARPVNDADAMTRLALRGVDGVIVHDIPQMRERLNELAELEPL